MVISPVDRQESEFQAAERSGNLVLSCRAVVGALPNLDNGHLPGAPTANLELSPRHHFQAAVSRTRRYVRIRI